MCLQVCMCVHVRARARLWDPGPTLARCDGELTSWRAAAPRRRASGEPSAVKRAAGDPPPIQPLLVSDTLVVPAARNRAVRCSAFARATLSSRGHRRTRCYAKLREILKNAIHAIENEFFGIALAFAEIRIRQKFRRNTLSKKHCLLVKCSNLYWPCQRFYTLSID